MGPPALARVRREGMKTARTPGTPRSERCRSAADDASHAAKQNRHVEVDDKGQQQTGGVQIRQRFCHRNGGESIHGVELDENATRDKRRSGRARSPTRSEGGGGGGLRIAVLVGQPMPPRRSRFRARSIPWRPWRPGGSLFPIGSDLSTVVGSSQRVEGCQRSWLQGVGDERQRRLPDALPLQFKNSESESD